jgi:hypothetical protein
MAISVAASPSFCNTYAVTVLREVCDAFTFSARGSLIDLCTRRNKQSQIIPPLSATLAAGTCLTILCSKSFSGCKDAQGIGVGTRNDPYCPTVATIAAARSAIGLVFLSAPAYAAVSTISSSHGDGGFIEKHGVECNG